MAKQFTYGKDEKLKSRKAIESLFTSGHSFTVYPIKLLYKLDVADKGDLKAGVAVSTRLFNKAVDRNRIKRLIRESYRTQKNELQETAKSQQLVLHVFFIYLDKSKTNYPAICETMKKCLDKLLLKLKDERPA